MFVCSLPCVQLSVDSGQVSSANSAVQTFSVTSVTLGTSDPSSPNQFDGCLANVVFNARRLNLTAAVTGTLGWNQYRPEPHNAEPGCSSQTHCAHCPPNSTCRVDWSCVCEPGYTATEEGKCVDPCDPNPCVHGTCRRVLVSGGTYSHHCECSDGYHGPTCVLSECGPGLFSAGSCQPCRCHPLGVDGNICSSSSGECTCSVSFYVCQLPHNYMYILYRDS